MKPSVIRQALNLGLGAAAKLTGPHLPQRFRQPLPQTNGTIPLRHLHRPVQVMRDRWGVPHIYADNNHDLFAALGYVHAQDRLWQMDLNRRTGHGQLAEVLGPLALDTDRFIRTLGFGRVAQQEAHLLDENCQYAVHAYIGGVNHYIETNMHRLPMEYGMVGLEPRPWTVADTLVWSKIIALNLCGNWTTELLNSSIRSLIGDEHTCPFEYPADHPLTIPPSAPKPAAPFPLTGEGGQGSNGWVVSGERSASGSPLLANDPHLLLTLPCIWYEVHLTGGDYEVTGVSFPGIPVILIGHNAHIAWGITNSMSDVQDLYIERFAINTPSQSTPRYLWNDTWREAEVVKEEITVRGKPNPYVETIHITHHGPVITPVAAPPKSPLATHWRISQSHAPATHVAHPWKEELALRWTALQPSTIFASLLALNQAQDWQQFRAALAQWDVPPQNFMYADTAGHTGYALAGALPIRKQYNSQMPLPGWTDAYEWTGYVPADELPARFDPPEGYIVNANNRITDDSHPHRESLKGNWFAGYRATRITDMLNATPHHTIATFAEIQQDVYSIPGKELARVMTNVPLKMPLEKHARDLLVAWDGYLTSDCVGGTIATVLRFHLEQFAHNDLNTLYYAQAGIGAFATLPYNSLVGRQALPDIIAQIDAATTREQRAAWQALLQKSIHQTVKELQERFGKDPRTWRYGQMHRLELRHPLGLAAPLAPLFNRGPWETGGDLDTVCMGYTPRATPTGAIYVGPSYRQICDTGNWDASCSIITGGQSGHPASRHYSDMVSLWYTGNYHPMLWSRSEVVRHTVAALTLEPEQKP